MWGQDFRSVTNTPACPRSATCAQQDPIYQQLIFYLIGNILPGDSNLTAIYCLYLKFWARPIMLLARDLHLNLNQQKRFWRLRNPARRALTSEPRFQRKRE